MAKKATDSKPVAKETQNQINKDPNQAAADEPELQEGEECQAKNDEEAGAEDAEARALVKEHFKTTNLHQQLSTKGTGKTADMMVKDKGYSVHEKLGSGSFATVFKVTRLSDRKEMAVKVIDISEKKERRLEDLKYELYTLQKTKHRNIVELFDDFTIDDKVYIFLELADTGTLSDFVRKKKAVSEKRSKRWFVQCVEAVQHMHGLRIAHRDIKLGNILLDKSGKQHTECKLTDFGLSRIAFHDGKGITYFSTYCGTPPYMAPEIIGKGEDGKRSYNPFPADIWALGVCLFAMVNKAYPFNPENMDIMLRNQKERKWKFVKKRAADISSDCKNIIANMLEPDSAKRITFAGIYNHKFTELNRGEKLSATNPSHPTGNSDAKLSEDKKNAIALAPKKN